MVGAATTASMLVYKVSDCELQWIVYYVQAKVNYFNLYTMARKYRKVAAAHARLAQQTQVYTATVRAIASNDSTVQEPNNDNDNIDNDDNNFNCGFTGGVHCLLPDTNSNSEFEMDCDLTLNQKVERVLLSWRAKNLKVVWHS
jgi:hypothetical protein